MAIYHLSAQVISAGGGKSAVAAAAYRHAARMVSASTGEVLSYEGKAHVVHTELALPPETPAWFRTGIDGRDTAGASEFLWNAVERKEGLRGTGLAMEMNIALPVELTREQTVALVRDWVDEHVTSAGFVADWALHDTPGNPHFHIMIPLRRLTAEGFGPKFDVARDAAGTALRRPDGKPLYERMAAPMKQLRPWRRSWAETTNRHLAMAGLDVRIDHRSHVEAGIAIEPTGHIGVTPSSMAARGKDSARVAEERERRARNAEAIVADPELLLPIITREKSVFDERDIARAVFRYVDDPAAFEAVRLRLGLSPELVAVAPEVIDPETERVVAPARWSTRTMLGTEVGMQLAAGRLWIDRSHSVDPRSVAAALEPRAFLADEQHEAVRHVTAPDRISAVVGFAGAGKSTMLGAAAEAWIRSGYAVHGAALSGKAAEGLQASASIPSRTLASWELAWSKGRDGLKPGDVFVLDEAGMVSSGQMARIVGEVERRGAKLVLVGDAMQLQPIEAGAAFRAITETVGYAELSGVRRQRHEWMREATIAFARGDTQAAFGAYHAHGAVRFTPTRDAAREALIAAWAPEFLAASVEGKRPDTLILAHANLDVFALNALARQTLKGEGRLTGEARFMTARGERMFAPGDRVMFLENDRALGVKNGMLASVVASEAGQLRVRLDAEGGEGGRVLDIEAATYRNLDHGYAATVHKSQGATVDRVHVLATPGMDLHLAYVGLSRHRESVVLHAAHADFVSPGQTRRIQGEGSAPEAINAALDAAALSGVMRRLGRDGSKETTLDHAGQSAFREAVSALDVSNPERAHITPEGSLRALARRLDTIETEARMSDDRVRPADLRALASAFAGRRGLNGYAAILPAVLTRARATLGHWMDRSERLQSVSSHLTQAFEALRSRTASVAEIVPAYRVAEATAARSPAPVSVPAEASVPFKIASAERVEAGVVARSPSSHSVPAQVPVSAEIASAEYVEAEVAARVPTPLPDQMGGSPALQSASVSDQPVADLAPSLPGFDHNPKTFDFEILHQAWHSEGVQRSLARLDGSVGRMVNEPTSLLTVIHKTLNRERSLTETPAAFADRIAALVADHTRHGGLRGKTGLFASRAAKDERVAAQAAVYEVKDWAARVKSTFDSHVEFITPREQVQRAAMRIPVPGLSPGTKAALRMFEASYTAPETLAALARFRAEPGAAAEVEAFMAAVVQRFGEGVFQPKDLKERVQGVLRSSSGEFYGLVEGAYAYHQALSQEPDLQARAVPAPAPALRPELEVAVEVKLAQGLGLSL